MRQARRSIIALALTLAVRAVNAQAPAANDESKWNESGFVDFGGQKTAYRIRHLPVSAFPALPTTIQAELNRRGCLIPQTYEAHQPENVIHGSFEKPGSQDWAVLCSARGIVSLLVFFADGPEKPSVLASSAETVHLQPRGRTGILGFNWGIDAASPERMREAQSSMEPRPPLLDHDAVAESAVEHPPHFHFYSRGNWRLLDTGD
jgi:hypothetical protein